MAAPTKDVPVARDAGMRRDIKTVGLLFTSVGSIIGSGWLFSAFDAATLVGPAAILSWLAGMVLIVLIAFAFAELGVMFPVSGGVARFPYYAFGPFASFTSGWIIWIAAAASVPIEVLATVQYATPYLPWLMREAEGAQVLTGPGLVVSVVLLALFSLVNIMGVKALVRLNNVLVWWKLGIIVLVVVVLVVVAFDPSHLTDARYGGFAPYGYDKVFAALPTAGIIFSFLGFRQGVEFAGETDNPRRNIPIAVIGSVLITGAIYLALQLAFLGGVPSDTLAKGWANLTYDNVVGPLAGLATLLGLTWLAVLLYVDAVVSPADTGLIYAGVTTRLGYAMARNGTAPTALTRLNRRGIPWVSVLVMFLVGCVFFLPFPSWSKLVGFIVSGAVLSFSTGPVTLAALRRQLPDQDRPFRVPGRDALPFLAFCGSNLIVYWTGWSTNWKLFLAVLLGYLFLVCYRALAKDKSRLPSLQLRSGWWMLPWLGGLCLISLLGHYQDGLGVLGFGWGELVVALFSLGIYALAVRVRLPVAECIAHARRGEPASTEPS